VVVTVPDKKLTAKERKEQTAEKSRQATAGKKPSGRRAGRVTTYVSQKAKVKKGRPKLTAAFTPKMMTPKGLSANARFDELRPDCISPLQWFQLFTPDESVWESLIEEAIEAVEDGELPRYADDGAANVSRRKLRELRGEVV
jgi:hypothetical protein